MQSLSVTMPRPAADRDPVNVLCFKNKISFQSSSARHPPGFPETFEEREDNAVTLPIIDDPDSDAHKESVAVPGSIRIGRRPPQQMPPPRAEPMLANELHGHNTQLEAHRCWPERACIEDCFSLLRLAASAQP